MVYEEFINIPKNDYFYVAKFIAYYIIPITGGFGVITHLLLQGTISSLRRKRRFYDLLQAKSAAECIFCALFIYSQNVMCDFCPEQTVNTYGFIFYRAYILTWGEIFHSLAFFFEVLISYERLCIFSHTKSWIDKIPAKYIFFGLVLIHAGALQIPYYFAVKIEYYPEVEKYAVAVSDQSIYVYFTISMVVLTACVYLAGSIVLLVFLILITMKYHIFVRSNINSRSSLKRNTAIIIISNTYFILYHFFNLAIYVFFNWPFVLDRNLNYLLEVVAVEFILFSYSISLFLCFLYDQKIPLAAFRNLEINI